MDFSFSIPIKFLTYTFDITLSHLFLFGLNITLFIFAGQIVKKFNYDGSDSALKIWGFRFFNMAFLVLQLADIILTEIIKGEYQQSLSKLSYTFITFYSCYLVNHILSHFSNEKFGKKKLIDDKEVAIVSYSSRMVNIILFGSLSFFAVITVINIWGYKSLLEATGMIGLLMGFGALSSSIWGPDLFHGLVLLNSNSIENGDIIEVEKAFFIVHKTSFMETSLLDVQNNCRARMRNSCLANIKIDNITKLAHSHGLRQTLRYKIGYPTDSSVNKESRQAALAEFNAQLKKMFDEAFSECCSDEGIRINANLPFEILLIDAGDFALEYSVSFYVSNVKKTRFTHQAREILKTKFLVNQKIFEESISYGVDLSTPMILNSHVS